MSRIGKKPVVIPAGVTVKVEDGATVVTGKLGTLTIPTQKHISVAVEGDQVVLSRDTDLDNAKAMHGLNRALIQNAVIGVSKGYSKSLEIVGVGFRADLAGNKLTLKLGFSHDINYTVPEGIKMTVADGYKITVEEALETAGKSLLHTGEIVVASHGFYAESSVHFCVLFPFGKYHHRADLVNAAGVADIVAFNAIQRGIK